MADIIPPSPREAISKDNGTMFQRFWTWTTQVTRVLNFLSMAEGSGNPETVVSSARNRFYNDTASGDLYWKSVDDVAGDSTQGWKLIS